MRGGWWGLLRSMGLKMTVAGEPGEEKAGPFSTCWETRIKAQADLREFFLWEHVSQCAHEPHVRQGSASPPVTLHCWVPFMLWASHHLKLPGFCGSFFYPWTPLTQITISAVRVGISCGTRMGPPVLDPAGARGPLPQPHPVKAFRPRLGHWREIFCKMIWFHLLIIFIFSVLVYWSAEASSCCCNKQAPTLGLGQH